MSLIFLAPTPILSLGGLSLNQVLPSLNEDYQNRENTGPVRRRRCKFYSIVVYCKYGLTELVREIFAVT